MLILHHGKRLAYLRNRLKKTQQEITQDLPISRSYMASLETGASPLSQEWFERFSTYFQVSEAYLSKDEPNAQFQERLEQSFSTVLSLDLAEDFKDPGPCFEQDCSLMQELAGNLLRAANFKLKYQFEEAAIVENDFLNLFIPESKALRDSVFLDKFWLLYDLATALIEADYEMCGDILCKIETYLTREDDFFSTQALLNFIYNKQNRLFHAFKTGRRIIQLAQDLNDPLRECLARGLFAQTLIHFDEIDEGTLELNECLSLLNQHGFQDYRWLYFLAMSMLAKSKQEYHEYSSYLESALDEDFLATTWLRFRYHYILLRFHESRLLTRRSLKGKQDLDVLSRLPRSQHESYHYLSFQAFVELLAGNEKNHWKLQRKAIQYFEERGKAEDFKILGEIYAVLGDYYWNTKKYRLSARYYAEMSHYSSPKTDHYL